MKNKNNLISYITLPLLVHSISKNIILGGPMSFKLMVLERKQKQQQQQHKVSTA